MKIPLKLQFLEFQERFEPYAKLLVFPRTSLIACRYAAFSLVEVVLALGIMVFAVTVLLGLFPVVLKENRSSLDEGNAMNLLSAVASDITSASWDATNTTRFRIKPTLGSAVVGWSEYQFVVDEAQTVVTNSDLASYQVVVRIKKPTLNSLQPIGAFVSIEWPVGGQHRDKVETYLSFSSP